jgi:glucokinase
MTNHAIGIDIGGTKTAIALVTASTGQISAQTQFPTAPELGPHDGLARIAAKIDRLLREAKLSPSDLIGIGIGATGPVDVLNRRIQNPYTLPGWDDVPIGDYLDSRFNRPVNLILDTQAAALGEYWQGSGRGGRNMVYITISTGIGSGIIINGSLYTGVGSLAGEIGHQVIDDQGSACYCGARGCWEMLSAGPAIATAARPFATRGSRLLELAGGDADSLTGKMVADAAQAGDADARLVLKRAARYIGVGTANLMNILAPDMIVLGGGVMQSWDLLVDDILAGIHERRGMVDFSQIAIKPAALGNDSGVIGAAYSAIGL